MMEFSQAVDEYGCSMVIQRFFLRKTQGWLTSQLLEVVSKNLFC